MLRESSQRSEQAVQLADVTRGLSDETQLPHADILMQYAEAVVKADAAATVQAREAVHRAMGPAAVIDAAATIAAFHGFVRIADAIGIPYKTAAAGGDVPDIREQVGVNDFHRVQNDHA
jgi:hypothetical protein